MLPGTARKTGWKRREPSAESKATAEGRKGIRVRIKGRKAEPPITGETTAEKPKRSMRQKILVPVDWIEDTTVAAGRKIVAAGKFIGRLPIRAGWWPMKERLTWVGFKSRVPRAIRAARAKEHREEKPARSAYRKVDQSKESKR